MIELCDNRNNSDLLFIDLVIFIGLKILLLSFSINNFAKCPKTLESVCPKFTSMLACAVISWKRSSLSSPRLCPENFSNFEKRNLKYFLDLLIYFSILKKFT